MVELGEKYGYRNAQVTCIAPTGTIGLVMDCDTTGVEPDFALVKFKKLAGGGYFKIINASIPPALARLGYTPRQIEDVVRYCRGAGTLHGCPHVNPASLRAKGFPDDVLRRIEAQLPGVFELPFVFNRWTVGDDVCVKNLGLTQEQIEAPDFDLLTALGFSRAQVEEANAYVCGTMTVEGAPHLKPEHLPVFDCANRCGKHGQRFLLRRVAHPHDGGRPAVRLAGRFRRPSTCRMTQPSRTCKNAYKLSWQLMLKANALYRDGSKLSQPLNTVADAPDLEVEAAPAEAAPEPKAEPVQIAEKIVYRYIAHRRRLPDRRAGYTQKSRIGNHKIYLRTGEYEDGTLGEIFIDMHKEGAAFRSMTNCFAIAISLGLQHGVPLEEYVDAFSVHALRAERRRGRQPAHQDDDLDHRLHLPRAGHHLSRPARPGPRRCGRPARRRHAPRGRGAGLRVGRGGRAAAGAGRAAADAEGLRHAAKRAPAAARGKRQRPQERRRHGRGIDARPEDPPGPPQGLRGRPVRRVRPAHAGAQRRLLQVRHLRGDVGVQLKSSEE